LIHTARNQLGMLENDSELPTDDTFYQSLAMKRTPYAILLAGLLILLFISGCRSKPSEFELALTDPQLEWVGQKIFQNECAGKESCLVHWNRGEAFPSLGIGHFIWYPRGVDGRFVESFPALIEFMRERSVVLPGWLEALDPLNAPWPDRDAFVARQDSNQVRSLRRFLTETKAIQAEFIFARAQASLARVTEAAPAAERPAIQQRLAALSDTPGGTYALIDYVNFKGEGLSPHETYQGQGWGLLQVLRQMSMSDDGSALQQFRQAAATVLTRRAHNAPKPIEREQWLSGWLNRLQTYREPPGLTP
jgi:hypothetical protein